MVSSNICSPSIPPPATTAVRFSCSTHFFISAQSSLSSSIIKTLFMFFFLSAFNRTSVGFSASFGISHKRLNFATPGMRFSSHSYCTRLSEMPHFFAASGAEINSNIFIHPFSKFCHIIICGQANHFKCLRTASRLNL